MNLLFSCIGRRGYIVKYFRSHLGPDDKIIGTSNSRWTPGLYACDLGVVMPDISDSGYVPTLIRLCQEQQVQAILSFFDPDINILANHLDEFRAIGVVPIIPSSRVNRLCYDKYLTYRFLKEVGFNTPKTYLEVGQAIDALSADEITFPLIVKPRFGRGSQSVFKARNVKELDVFFNYASEMVIQESLIGQEFHFDICNNLQGQVISVVPKRKVSMRAGETDQAEIRADPGLIEVGLRLGEEIGRLGGIGPIDVDIFVQDDNVTILEINPRFGGGYPMSQIAGADFPRLILEMIQGKSPKPEIGKFRTGMIMMKDYDILGGDPLDFFDSICNMRRSNRLGTITIQSSSSKIE